MTAQYSGKAVGHLFAAFAISVAFVGAARSQALQVPLKGTYKGSVVAYGYANNASCKALYTVPSGVAFRLTDFLVSNYTAVDRPLRGQYIYYTSGSTCSGSGDFLVYYFTVPAGTTLTHTFSTGLRVGSGETVCVCNSSGTSDQSLWTLTGFTYTIP